MRIPSNFFFAVLGIVLAASSVFSQNAAKPMDWPNLTRYKEDNARLNLASPDSRRVVLMGNSITEGWVRQRPEFFAANPFLVGRGISGQTTAHMLLRFRQDVIKLKPALVVMLCGVNDIAQNAGPVTQEEIMDNIRSMAELAKIAEIKVVLCSVLPASDFGWRPGLEPGPKIASLNRQILAFAKEQGFGYIDYYAAMEDGNYGLRAGLSNDKVHPTDEGYAVMEPLLLAGISRALQK